MPTLLYPRDAKTHNITNTNIHMHHTCTYAYTYIYIYIDMKVFIG